MKIGLCAACEHVRVTGNRRGSTFYLCSLSETDARFRRYPPLPVLSCDGFQPRAEGLDPGRPQARENPRRGASESEPGGGETGSRG